MKKSIILLILLLSVSAVRAESYWTLIAQIGSAPSSFAFSSNDVMYAGTLGSGVYRSTNYGSSWTQLNNGLNDLNVYSLGINASGQIFAGTQSHGIYFSSNSGSSWIHTSLSVSVKVKSIAINSSGHIFAGTNGSGVYRSTNNGSTWVSLGTLVDVYSIAIDGNNRIFAGCGSPIKAVYRSTNNGTNWAQVYTADHNFNSIAINNSGTVYSATGNLITDNPLGDIIVRSYDGGDTWEVPYTFGTSSYGLVVNSVGHLFLGRYRSVWVSTDRGESWNIHADGLVLDSGIVFSYGVNSQGYVYAGQENGYIYRTTASTIGIKKIAEDVPVSYALYQNYPNPFNPVTKIKFSILPLKGTRGMITKLTIYDIFGKEVKVIVNEGLQPGTYEADWDASNYPSGVYFYRLESNNFTATNKMILLK